ncbi:MAG TPA: TonB-dependent receptor [Steroidobacteraceae bacterium]|nr:TonB-dependent receptor [Steroidobacteraceae bacterium]
MSKNTILRRAIRLALANAAAAAVALPALAPAADQATPAPSTSPPAPAAAAAAAPAVAPPTAALQEVVVTGSRIVQPGLSSISPVTAISAKDIASQGVTSVEDVLNSLPQVMADQGAMSSNGATGTAVVDLRGLGPQRTLVLVDGKRMMPGQPSTVPLNANAADLDNIPIALIERVDVLTGGAAAVYGADAVAGVVNFVMNDHFQGFEIDANASAYQHDQHSWYGQFAPAHSYGSPPSSVFDGGTKDITMILGGNFADGKGNAVAYVGYRRTDPVTEATRDFSRCTLGTSKDVSVPGEGTIGCSGSSTSATGRFFNHDFQSTDPSNPLSSVPISFSPFLTVDPATGQFVPFVSSVNAYNFGALNYYMRPDERWNAGAFVHYNIDDNHQVYTSLMFMDDDSLAQIAPSGAFIGTGLGVNPATGEPDGEWVVNCNNPLLSAQEASTFGCASNSTALSNTQTVQTLFGRRNVEGGNRVTDTRHTSYRFVIGSKGQLSSNLSYDVFAQEGVTLRNDLSTNDLLKSSVENALDAQLQVDKSGNPVINPATGRQNVVCAANNAGNYSAPGCVPWNIWGTGPVDPASVAYMETPGLIEGVAEERVYHADMTSDLTEAGFKLPTANEGLGLNFGVEYREEFMRVEPDYVSILGALTGTGSPSPVMNAGYGVKEGFIEARLPLVQDRPGIKEISIDTAYRYSKYDVGFTTNTYKLGVDYSPTSSLRFRGGYNRAVRAPNIAELFADDIVALDGSQDPCAGSSTSSHAAATIAQCQRSGLSAAQYGKFGTPANPVGQYNGRVGGNPNLKPEIADTYTFGIVATPSFLPTFSATVDVFDIKIKNLISSYGANLIVKQCVFDDNPPFCSMVHRDPAGSLWFSTFGYVDDPLLNLGYEKESGLDVSLNYTQRIGALGSLRFNLIGTYTASFVTEPYAGSGTYNCAGYFGATCGNPLPKWRHTLTTSWATPWHGIGLQARWRHIGSTEIDLANPSPLLAGAFGPAIQWTGTRDYLDLVASDQIFSSVSLQVGVNNVLDKDPPILATGSLPPPFTNGNTYPQVYDTLGRFVFANLKIDF